MRPTGIGVTVLAVICAAAFAGCGGGDDNGQDTEAGRAAQEYVDAYNGHDFEDLCQLLSDSYKADLLAGEGEEEEKIRCPEWYEEHTSGAATTLTLAEVKEEGDQATAHIRSQSEDTAAAQNDQALRLMRQPNGSWQVTDLTTYSGSD